MKANSLYHLMQVRARNLSEHLPGDIKIVLLEIQSSIKIKRQSGTFTLDWKIDQIDYSFTLDSDPFKFYEKGDSDKYNVKRGDNLNYRSHNWDASLELWKDIFKTSNLDSGRIIDDGRLAFGKPLNNKTNITIYHDLGVALLLSLWSTIKYTPTEAVQLFTLILMLLLFANNFSSVHLRKPLHIIEMLIIAVGCIIPLYYGVNLTGGIFLVAGLYLLGVAERQRKYKSSLFTLSGIVLGLAVYSMGGVAIVLVGVISLILILVSIVDSQRINMSSTILFLVGFIATLLGMYVLIETGSISLYTPQEIMLGKNLINWTAIGFLTLLFISFSMWWIIGIQYYLLPWLSMLALSIATLAGLFFARNDVLLMLGIFSGFTLFILERVLAGFVYSNPGSGRINIKMDRNG